MLGSTTTILPFATKRNEEIREQIETINHQKLRLRKFFSGETAVFSPNVEPCNKERVPIDINDCHIALFFRNMTAG